MTQPRVFSGRYELGELIGYGGMAEVHRGRDLRLNRDVAIKVLRADLARDPSFLNRFRREAHSAAGLNHPSIVSVYDTGEEEGLDGTTQPYIVMEFVEGRTLRDILRSEGRLPARRAMEITADVCAALDFSHRNGIIHRDIKPANVMITPTGAVKVMDFGIARAVADNSATVTQTANVIGTAQYLSPEQARGETVDARSDVYSTGCLLYELVTGNPPFQGDSPVAVAYQHVRENPVLPSARTVELPRAVDSIVMKSLAKNTMNRYQTAGDMRQDLQRALANQPVVAEAVMTDAERTQFIARTPPPPVAVQRREEQFADEPGNQRRNGLIWLAVVLAMLLVIGGAAWAILKYRTDDKATAKITVPNDLIGITAAAAEDELRSLKLTPIHGSDVSGQCDGGATGKDGHVCKVTPAPGEKVEKGGNVTYQLFKEASVQVPDVSTIGISYADAAKRLTDLDLRPTPKPVNSSEPKDTVIAQDPPAYKDVPVNTVITLSVSTGKVNLPKVIGLSDADAKAKLNSVGYTNVGDSVAPRETQDQSLDGTVAAQDPTGGIAYPLSQKITLTLYAYVAPTTSCPPDGSSSSSSSSSPPGSSSSPSTSCSASSS